MANHTHAAHGHAHGPGCGHKAIAHEGHVDYLHDGHLHHERAGEYEEHRIADGGRNASKCGQGHACSVHDKAHRHGPGCGHESVPHGDHVDYLVGGHLHHVHDGHCDDHGPVDVRA
jgi:hypothetical protein